MTSTEELLDHAAAHIAARLNRVLWDADLVGQADKAAPIPLEELRRQRCRICGERFDKGGP
jgi:hypothetical protein